MNRKKKLLVTVGGSGGHVFPATAVVKDLLEKDPDWDVLFAGGGLSKNRFFQDEAFQVKDVSYGAVSLKQPWKTLKSAVSICKGFREGLHILNTFKPDLVLGFGSYHTFPLLAAATWQDYPLVIHEANSIPGKVNRLFAPRALQVGVLFPDTSITGAEPRYCSLPLRPTMNKEKVSREAAFRYFGLKDDKPVLLIFGGSQGARGINQKISIALGSLAKSETSSFIQILHFTGDTQTSTQLKALYHHYGYKACVKDFELNMHYAFAIADLAVTRAGGGTCAEAIEFELPMIQIPYPHASENHQLANANFMARRVEGSIVIQEQQLTPEIFMELLTGLFNNNAEKLLVMRANLRRYKSQLPLTTLTQMIQQTMDLLK